MSNLIRTSSSTSFTQLVTFGKRHHYPPYSMLCDFLWGLHLNDIFSRDSQMGVPKLRPFVVLKFWMFIFSSNQTCLKNEKIRFFCFQKNLSNRVLHAPIKDHLTIFLKRFVVGNQIKNLILAFSFNYNSCISSLNNQCEGILCIYISNLFNNILRG